MSEQRRRRNRAKDADQDPVHEAAAEWFAKLREPDVSLEDVLAWQRWMNAEPRHGEAFARIEEVSTLLRSVPVPSLPSASEADDDGYDAEVPVSAWQASKQVLFSKPGLARLVAWATAASVLVAIAAVAWVNLEQATPASTFETQIGETRTVTLADGSKVTLGGATTVTALLRQDMREIGLIRGEAFFSVAKDAIRPFEVHAGDTTVVAIGTEFNVARLSDRVVVSVVEGRVKVEPASGLVPAAVMRQLKPKRTPVKLSAGEQTTAGDAGIEPPAALPDMSAITSWQAGRLTFRAQPLRYVIEDVNRYSAKPIMIEDERLAARLFTGTVAANNVKAWLGGLQSAFEIEAVEEPERVLLKEK
ncbi:MAG: FecR domain-containing protein [Gammaproteobacteria bacterium]